MNPITTQLAQWLRSKADELDGQNFPSLTDSTTIKEVFAALTLSEPDGFAIVMELEHRSGTECEFKIRGTKYDCIAAGATLSECYANYLQNKKPKVDPVTAACEAVEIQPPF